jgi:hypothetical protein
MIRCLLTPEGRPLFECDTGADIALNDINTIATYNSLLRQHGTVGTVRGSKGDVGSMYALGTRVLKDCISTCEYAANSKMPRDLLKQLVEAMARVGSFCFPDVLAVVHDMKEDSGVVPVEPMGGDEKGLRVGYSIDTSVDLGNAAHYDVHDASQGFSVKTEDTPGTGANWFFLLPNVHGVRGDGTHFNGIAIKLRHGTVISWDGRVVKHCTAVPIPGGNNHVYGTFTAAKERIVGVGRALAGKSKLSDNSATGASSADDGFDASGGKRQRSK